MWSLRLKKKNKLWNPTYFKHTVKKKKVLCLNGVSDLPIIYHNWATFNLPNSSNWSLFCCSSPLTPSAAAVKSLQSCPTLCDPIDGSPPGSPVPGILQARILEWVATSSPMHESGKWKWSHSLLATPWTAACQAPPSMGFSRQEYWSGVPLLFVSLIHQKIPSAVHSQNPIFLPSHCQHHSLIRLVPWPLIWSFLPPLFPDRPFSTQKLERNKITWVGCSFITPLISLPTTRLLPFQF